MPELTTTSGADPLRSELSRPRIQVPLWVSLILLIAGITCSAWSRATGDIVVGMAGTGALILFVPAVLLIESAVWRSVHDIFEPKESHD